MNQPHLLSQQELNQLIDTAADFDVNRDALFIYGSVHPNHPDPIYMIEYVWATSEVHIHPTPDSPPITYHVSLSLTKPQEDEKENA